ncbi:DUF5753 domain-containing protein, partial [Actinomadura adrarensis]
DYARAVIRAQSPHLTDGEVDERVQLRMERQERFLRDHDPLRLWAIMGEGALHRLVGSPAVMADQMEHLHRAAQLDTVDVQVLPFGAGAPASGTPFVELTFADPLDPEVIYLETAAGDLWIEGAQVAAFQVRFEDLISRALSAPATLRMLLERAEHFRKADA